MTSSSPSCPPVLADHHLWTLAPPLLCCLNVDPPRSRHQCVRRHPQTEPWRRGTVTGLAARCDDKDCVAALPTTASNVSRSLTTPPPPPAQPDMTRCPLPPQSPMPPRGRPI